jgi:hypothetical protein
LIALDYTSLYPSACIFDEEKNKTARLLVPDLKSVRIYKEEEFD